MRKIVKSFIQSLPALQAEKIQEELLKDSLSFQNPEDLRAELQDRISAFISNNQNIRFQQHQLSVNERRDSERINDMLEKIYSDLNALTLEAENLIGLQNLQSKLYREEMLEGLLIALEQAENRVESLELLNGNPIGLKSALIETFNGQSKRLLRSSSSAGFVYVDPKRSLPIASTLDLVNTPNGAALAANSQNLAIVSSIEELKSQDSSNGISVLLTEGKTSSNGIETITGSLLNIIDNTNQTFWTKELIAKDIDSAYVSLYLHLSDGGVPVNYIQIEPVSSYNMKIDEIKLLKSDSTVVALDKFAGTNLNQKLRLNWETQSCRGIFLRIKQENLVLINNEERSFKFGFDNIKTGFLTYEKLGIFASETLSLPRVTSLYCKGIENSFISAEGNLPLIEYWIIFREISTSGKVLSLRLLPISSYGTTKIKEVLIPNKNNSANLSFCVDPLLPNNSEDLKLYRNQTLLTRGVDYSIDPDSTALIGETKLNINNSYDKRDIYIAEYVPLHTKTDTLDKYITDKTSRFIYLENGNISLAENNNPLIQRVDVNLIAIMRSVSTEAQTSALNKIIFAIG